jgi:serine phosphatase RsbU (regulator of sigma subunit)
MKDSITNKTSMKKFASLEYRAKEEQLKNEQLKKDITYKAEKIQKEEELRRQKIVRNGFIVGAVLLCGLVFFVYRNLRQSKKAHKIIAEQKRQVEMQKEITEEQKKLVEEKQKEIVDSINYAKKIQQNLFPTEIYIEKTLNRLMKKL